MSKVGVSLKINLSAMDLARLFKGQKGEYLDATVFIDLDQQDQYGNNGMITQDVSKEEKSQGVKGNILGNVKLFWSDNNQSQAPQQGYQQPRQQAPQQAPAPQYNQAPPQQRAPQPTPQHRPQQSPAQQRAPQQPQQQPPQAQYNDPSMDFDKDIPF